MFFKPKEKKSLVNPEYQQKLIEFIAKPNLYILINKLNNKPYLHKIKKHFYVLLFNTNTKAQTFIKNDLNEEDFKVSEGKFNDFFMYLSDDISTNEIEYDVLFNFEYYIPHQDIKNVYFNKTKEYSLSIINRFAKTSNLNYLEGEELYYEGLLKNPLLYCLKIFDEKDNTYKDFIITNNNYQTKYIFTEKEKLMTFLDELIQKNPIQLEKLIHQLKIIEFSGDTINNKNDEANYCYEYININNSISFLNYFNY